jgi:hypothetical protein
VERTGGFWGRFARDLEHWNVSTVSGIASAVYQKRLNNPPIGVRVENTVFTQWRDENYFTNE